MDKSVVKIEPATQAHVTAIYGHPLPQTVRGFAGIYEDAPVVVDEHIITAPHYRNNGDLMREVVKYINNIRDPIEQ